MSELKRKRDEENNPNSQEFEKEPEKKFKFSNMDDFPSRDTIYEILGTESTEDDEMTLKNKFQKFTDKKILMEDSLVTILRSLGDNSDSKRKFHILSYSKELNEQLKPYTLYPNTFRFVSVSGITSWNREGEEFFFFLRESAEIKTPLFPFGILKENLQELCPKSKGIRGN